MFIKSTPLQYVFVAIIGLISTSTPADASNLGKRNAGLIFMCTSANFGGSCAQFPFDNGVCVNLPTTSSISFFDKKVVSFRPDTKAICTLFTEQNCISSGNDALTRIDSAENDLGQQGFAVRMSSYACIEVAGQ